jgi:hypothetical protein
MKNILILFALFCSASVGAQNSNWSAIGSAGGGIHKITDKGALKLVPDTKLTAVADAGIRYNIGMLHLQSGISYWLLRYDADDRFLVEEGIHSGGYNKIINKQFMGIPLMIGFNYNRQSRIYPLVQAGIIAYYSLNDFVSWHNDKNFVLTLAGNAGIGINLSNKIAIEPSFFYKRATKVIFSKDTYDTYTQAIGAKLSAVFRL